VKGLYSLYRKLERKDGDIDKILDLLAVRVIVGTVEDCYRGLGVVHTLWHPLPGKIKDYIAFHKPNGYRSIHTTVMTPEAGPVEIQLRTEEMHREAQFGIASHISYKESGSNLDRGQQKRERLWYKQLIPSLLRISKTDASAQNGKNAPHWVSELAEAHNVETLSSTETFMRELQDDFFSHRIFIFTPKGDVVDLPMDSTTIDFAYAIHSEIGHHTSRAKVNGKLVALDTTLKNGDIVEIETSKTAHPSSKWIEYVRTSMARRHINQWLTHQHKEKEADSH
jgi:GTP pyrophosphokinase